MIAQADAFRLPFPDQYFHTALTSPPYWGLRKYAGEQGRIWGGDLECEHEWGAFITDPVKPVNRRCEKCQKFGVAVRTTGENVEIRCAGCNHITYTTSDTRGVKGIKGKKPAMSNLTALEYETIKQGQFCQLCGAWYGSLGLEPTPEQHIENIVEICREVRRVLRDDGVFWLNYGDCYATSPKGSADKGTSTIGEKHDVRQPGMFGKKALGVIQGSLMMMPHRVALALQQDGWIIRQDLVWSKPNPMPESLNGWRWQREREKVEAGKTRQSTAGMPGYAHPESDAPDFTRPHSVATWEYGDDLELRKGSWRHTRAHEYVFMLVKGMGYWSNQEAVREANTQGTIERLASGPVQALGKSHKNIALGQQIGGPDYQKASGRNPRSVLDVPTQPYSGAHYATFPVNLIAPLIRATCPRWACPVCGQGWAAVVDRVQGKPQHVPGGDNEKIANDGARGKHGATSLVYTGGGMQSNILGYRPTCEHEHTQEEAVPGTVFDPFVGSGTTVAVAKSLLRRGVGIDISMEYLDQQAKIRAGLGTPSNALDDLPLFAVK